MTLFIISPATEARIAWVSRARCRSTDPDEFFVRGAAQRKAAVICRHCPAVAQCLADALDNQMKFGVWGAWLNANGGRSSSSIPRLIRGPGSSPPRASTATSANRRNHPLLAGNTTASPVSASEAVADHRSACRPPIRLRWELRVISVSPRVTTHRKF